MKTRSFRIILLSVILGFTPWITLELTRATPVEANYMIKEGDVFIWKYSEIDFVDNDYFLKFTIQKIFENQSIRGTVEKYNQFLDISKHETVTDGIVLEPDHYLGIIPHFDIFGLNFDHPIFINSSQKETYLTTNVSIETINIVNIPTQCFFMTIDGKDVWIDTTHGVIVKIEYASVYSFELVSWQDVNFETFVNNYEEQERIATIYYIIISVFIASLVITTHLMIRKRKLRKNYADLANYV